MGKFFQRSFAQGKLTFALVFLRLLLMFSVLPTSSASGTAPPPLTGDQVSPDPASNTVLVGFVGARKQPAHVGAIFIVGNEYTSGAILEDIPLCTGSLITLSALREAEKNLANLGLFETSADGSVRPTVTILLNAADVDQPNFACRDIVITVKEPPADTRTFMHWIYSADSGVTGHILRDVFRSWK
jgi:hypothetical protein